MDEMVADIVRPLQREQLMKFGTQITAHGVRFRLWAPDMQSVSVKLDEQADAIPMLAYSRGWFEVEVEGVRAGARYRFITDDGTQAPDPASRFQPDDVDGPSEVIDPRAFEWTDIGWRGRPWEEAIFYEIHVGTFTPEGTWAAATTRLDQLVDLGITAIELMPIADFRGRWNWGYDGALLFAPDSSYGRPDELKAFVDAAHARGLMVILDVVYNHFGAKGNYLDFYAPALTDKHETPWGPAVNFDDEGSAMIRDFIFANARYWLNEYHLDGLRFDAVHAIQDSGPKHMLQDLAEQIRSSTDGRHIHLVAENSHNQAGWLKRLDDGRPQFYTAQWSDDIHHCLHTLVTGEDFWYYADFLGRIDLLGRSLAEGFAWQGEYMKHEGANKGEPSAFLPPTAFVSFIQNHDQVGNRPFGNRLNQLIPLEAVRALTALNLLAPQIPLLFMGEEWGAKQPFLFFSDMGDDFADMIRDSRKKELEDAPGSDAIELPDPMAEESFTSCKLDWNDRSEDEGQRHLSFIKRLIGIRKSQIIPRLAGIRGHSGQYELLAAQALKVSWRLGDESTLSVFANLSPETLNGVKVWSKDHLWLEGFATDQSLGPWTVVWTLSPHTR